MNLDFTDFPDSFRKNLFDKVFTAINRHESVTLLAPPGMGKTLALQLLSKKLSESLYIDLNGKWEKNINTERPVTIILDHAENQFDQLYFKSVRESGRDRINFIFAISGYEIPTGPLKPVMLENIVYLEPLNEIDSLLFLRNCEDLFGEKLPKSDETKILTLAGGIPRIIKRLCKLFLDKTDWESDIKLQNDLEEIAKFLKANPKLDWTIPILHKSDEATETINEVSFFEPLSKQEYLLAKLLIENKDSLVTREQMIETVWQSKMYDINDHALDQMLHRLRKKLENSKPKCKLISYRGRGCKLESS